jgi:hypothetical protein
MACDSRTGADAVRFPDETSRRPEGRGDRDFLSAAAALARSAHGQWNDYVRQMSRERMSRLNGLERRKQLSGLNPWIHGLQPRFRQHQCPRLQVPS